MQKTIRQVLAKMKPNIRILRIKEALRNGTKPNRKEIRCLSPAQCHEIKEPDSPKVKCYISIDEQGAIKIEREKKNGNK